MDCILLLTFSMAIKRVGGDGEGMGVPAAGSTPQYCKKEPMSQDDYCSILYNENLKATLMFNCNRVSLSKLATIEYLAVLV